MKTPEDEAFEDIERKNREAQGWRKRQIASLRTKVESFDEWEHSHRPEQYWVERRAYLAGFEAGVRNERMKRETND
jgi:predicted metal-dependent HD superfamily phosphohydrolase